MVLISTHAPAWGGDRPVRRRWKTCPPYFYSRPAWGATVAPIPSGQTGLISTHAPRVGGDTTVKHCCQHAGFSVGFGVAMSQALGPFTLRAGVASSVLGIAQVCGSSLWIWLAAIIGLSAMNMLIGILIACSIVSLVLLLVVTPPRVAQYDEEAAVES